MLHRLRTGFAAAAVAALTSLSAAPAGADTVLRLVPQADLKILDTTWTNALITRNYGLMVYDTLFALDSNLRPKPQLVEGWTRTIDAMPWPSKLGRGPNFRMDRRSPRRNA